MCYRTYEFSVLDYRAAAHSLHDTSRYLEQRGIGYLDNEVACFFPACVEFVYFCLIAFSASLDRADYFGIAYLDILLRRE